MTTKYNIGDKVELKAGGILTIDTIKINQHNTYYYTQANNRLYADSEIKGLAGVGSKDITYKAKPRRNDTKTKSDTL